jgi:hypothetical protein
MASPVLDIGVYSPTEQQALLTAAKTEYSLRLQTGRVNTGSSAAQSYGLTVLSNDDLVRLINGLAAALNLDSVNARVEPNFNTHRGCAIPGYPVTL